MTAAVTPYASRIGHSPRAIAGSYNFAFGGIRNPNRPKPPPPAEPLECIGYELLGVGDVVIATFACFLDACDRLREHRGPGKIVRCSDRALLKIRHPHRGRP